MTLELESCAANFEPSFHDRLAVRVALKADGAWLSLDDGAALRLPRATEARLRARLAALDLTQPLEAPHEMGNDGISVRGEIALSGGHVRPFEAWSPTKAQHPRAYGFFMALCEAVAEAVPSAVSLVEDLRGYFEVGISELRSGDAFVLEKPLAEHLAGDLLAKLATPPAPRFLDLSALESLPARAAQALAELEPLCVVAAGALAEQLRGVGFPSGRLYTTLSEGRAVQLHGRDLVALKTQVREALSKSSGVVSLRLANGTVVVRVSARVSATVRALLNERFGGEPVHVESSGS